MSTETQAIEQMRNCLAQLTKRREKLIQELADIDAAFGQMHQMIEKASTQGNGSRGLTPDPTQAQGATGEQQLLSYISQAGSEGITTRQAADFWKARGFRSRVNNLLTRLVKEGRLKRQPLPDRAGSRYVVTG